jgi:hypothetical protein
MTPQKRAQLISKIERFPANLRSALKGITKAELATPFREGGWTASQVVHHLADSHLNAYVRARLILTEDNPTLRPYSQDDWARLPDAQGAPLKPSLAILDGLHARWAALFRAVPKEAWSRPAQHPEYGATSLEGILASYAAHGEAHLAHIGESRKRGRPRKTARR